MLYLSLIFYSFRRDDSPFFKRQVVAYAIGDRSEQTCRRLWEAIPSVYCAGHCYTDFWAAYQAVIPEEQHTAVGKATGEAAHVERWNNTLRQRLARFVRKTLSFSKSLVMHEACLRLFLHRYNLERARPLPGFEWSPATACNVTWQVAILAMSTPAQDRPGPGDQCDYPEAC